MPSRAWVEVDVGALARNLIAVVRALGPRVRVVPMVKADGYGLGARRVVAALERQRPFGYGVATVAEGVELRRSGVGRPVLACSPVAPAELARAAAADVAPAVSDLGSLRALAELARGRAAGAPPLPFQVEVDTGMGRSGFSLAEGSGWWDETRRAARRGLRLVGVFTHLHSADAGDLSSARAQVRRFEDFVGGVEGIGPDVLLHFANGAGALRLASRVANAARPGYYLYGGRIGGLDDLAPPPEPVAALRARVALVRDARAGETLGYGATYRARGRERWATATVGYGDGLPRALGNRGFGIARGRRWPIKGRVSMDTTVLRASPAVSVGDVVTFVGRDGGAELGLDEVGAQVGMIGYQILVGLSSRLPRVTVR